MGVRKSARQHLTRLLHAWTKVYSARSHMCNECRGSSDGRRTFMPPLAEEQLVLKLRLPVCLCLLSHSAAATAGPHHAYTPLPHIANQFAVPQVCTLRAPKAHIPLTFGVRGPPPPPVPPGAERP